MNDETRNIEIIGMHENTVPRALYHCMYSKRISSHQHASVEVWVRDNEFMVWKKQVTTQNSIEMQLRRPRQITKNTSPLIRQITISTTADHLAPIWPWRRRYAQELEPVDPAQRHVLLAVDHTDHAGRTAVDAHINNSFRFTRFHPSNRHAHIMHIV